MKSLWGRDQISASSSTRLHGNSAKQGARAEKCYVALHCLLLKAQAQKYAEEKSEEGRKERERVSNNGITNGFFSPGECNQTRM